MPSSLTPSCVFGVHCKRAVTPLFCMLPLVLIQQVRGMILSSSRKSYYTSLSGSLIGNDDFSSCAGGCHGGGAQGRGRPPPRVHSRILLEMAMLHAHSWAVSKTSMQPSARQRQFPHTSAQLSMGASGSTCCFVDMQHMLHKCMLCCSTLCGGKYLKTWPVSRM